MLVLNLLLSCSITSVTADNPFNTQNLNQLINQGNKTIEETALNVRPSGLRLPFYSLNWPTPSLGDENYQNVPGKGQGIELTADKGTEIVAPASGIVKYVGPMGEHPSVVIVDHRQHINTIFIGLDNNSVKVGQSVYSGQKFARLPSYGAAAHTYFFELRHKGRSINPLPFLKRRG